MEASTYTRKQLDSEARYLARLARKETKGPARLNHWRIIVGGVCPALIAVIDTPTADNPHKQIVKNMAI